MESVLLETVDALRVAFYCAGDAVLLWGVYRLIERGFKSEDL